ncbi:MAG: hypothetical protein MIO92_12210, partial [Methanosarcinaceae archaeon]|nr:hypothetical protein [Methanosarcinaceae archaeon]
IKDCPQAVWIGDFVNEENDGNGYQVVRIPYDRVIHLSSRWLAMDDILLGENLENIEWVFKIDGQDYFIPDMLKADLYAVGDGDEIPYPGKWLGVVLEGWEIGEVHEVEIGFIVKDDVFDGWRTTKAGTSFVTTYQLIPARIPTSTLTSTPTLTSTTTATATLTPRPTNTRAPVQPVTTSPGGVTLNLTIKVVNKCTNQRTVVFTGPTNLTFILNPGQSQEQRAMQGTYKWTETINANVSLIFGPLAIYTYAWTLTLCS